MVIFGRRAMKRIAVLALMVAGLLGSALCQYSAEFSSYYSGKRYDFRITPEQLSSTPAWLDGELNPPLSARSAKDIAAVYLSDLFKNASAWRVEGDRTVSSRRTMGLFDLLCPTATTRMLCLHVYALQDCGVDGWGRRDGNQIALESPYTFGENLPSLRSHLSKFSLLLTA
jgi:hypothetical protein